MRSRSHKDAVRTADAARTARNHPFRSHELFFAFEGANNPVALNRLRDSAGMIWM